MHSESVVKPAHRQRFLSSAIYFISTSLLCAAVHSAPAFGAVELHRPHLCAQTDSPEGEQAQPDCQGGGILDTTPPKITLARPRQTGLVSYLNAITVSGFVDEPLSDLTINNNPVTLAPDRTFSTALDLTEGLNTISIAATDVYLNVRTRDVEITYEPRTPVAVIDTFDGETAVEAAWDSDGDVVYQRDVTNAEAFEGKKSFEVAYRKNVFAPYSFFAFTLAAGLQDLSSYETLSLRVKVTDGASVSLLAKIEDGQGGVWEAAETVPAGGGWTEVTYDLTQATFDLSQVENIIWMVNPGDTASEGTLYMDQIVLVNTDPAYLFIPETPVITGPAEGFGAFTLDWQNPANTSGRLYTLFEDDAPDFSSPVTYYTNQPEKTIETLGETGLRYYRVYALNGAESQPDTRLSGPGNVVTVNLVSGPPVIEKVDSFVGDDVDGTYPSGSLVRINVLELYRAENVVSGTVQITSASTGYDSGVEALSYDADAESWFYLWVANDLEAADDYTVLATLTNDLGLTDPDGSDDDPDHTISLTVDPPLIKTLFTVDEFSVPAQGLDVSFSRTHKASSLFDGVMGRGWFHSYEIFLEMNEDGSRVVVDGPRGELFYKPDGQGGYAATKPNNHAELFDEAGGGYRLRFKDGLTYRFDQSGRLETITDRNGSVLSFSYDENGFLGAVTDASNQTTTFGYTLFSGGAWRLTDATDPFGRTWIFVYHPDHSLFAVEDPLGNAENYFYHPTGDLSLRVDRSGVQTFYNYYNDEKRRLMSRNIPGDISRVDYVYGPGARIQLTDGLNRTTIREYSASGLLISETNPLLEVTRFEYDGDRNLTRVIDALDNETVMTYDDRGNLLTREDPLHRTTVFTYEPVFNQVETITDPRLNTTTLRYDPNGNLIEIEDALTNITSFTFDAFGNVESSRDPLLHETTFTYTAQGLVETVTDPLLRVAAFAYDERGNRTQETDPNLNDTFFTYDILDRVTARTNRLSAVTSFTYTPTGKLKTLTGHNQETVTYAYDHAERLTSRTYPDNSVESFAYDKANNIVRTVDRGGVDIDYQYDELNRLKTKVFPDSSAESYSYDEIGRLETTGSTAAGIFSFQYDDAGQLTGSTTTRPVPKAMSYAYDESGNRISRIDHELRETTFAYDELNRTTGITTAEGLNEYEYDIASRVTGKILSNGPKMNFGHDTADQLISIETRSSSDALLQTRGYVFDALGNIEEKTTDIGVSLYDYDDEGQLTEDNDVVSGQNVLIYDALGNRLSAGGVTYTVNNLNQYEQAGTTVFIYDNAGRMTSRNVAGEGVTTYGYDFHGRLNSVERPDGTALQFTYDPFGRRHKRTVTTGTGTTTVYFLYDGDEVIAEVDSLGSEIRSYEWGIALDELLLQREGPDTWYALHDHQYSVTAFTDGNENIVESYTYDAFGNSTDGITDRLTSYGYTGRYYESEIGLYYYRNRFYDSSLGRFISPDPLLFVDGPNLYTYVTNNPQGFRDPYGLNTDDNEEVPDDIDELLKELERLLRELEALLEALRQLLELLNNTYILPPATGGGIGASEAVPMLAGSVAGRGNPGILRKEHGTNRRPSNIPKHQRGEKRKKRDQGGEKGDVRRPWPPKKFKGGKSGSVVSPGIPTSVLYGL